MELSIRLPSTLYPKHLSQNLHFTTKSWWVVEANAKYRVLYLNVFMIQPFTRIIIVSLQALILNCFRHASAQMKARPLVKSVAFCCHLKFSGNSTCTPIFVLCQMLLRQMVCNLPKWPPEPSIRMQHIFRKIIITSKETMPGELPEKCNVGEGRGGESALRSFHFKTRYSLLSL